MDFDLKEFTLFKKYEIEKTQIPMIAHVFLSQLNRIEDFNQLEGHEMKLFTVDEALQLKVVDGDKLILNDLKTVIK